MLFHHSGDTTRLMNAYRDGRKAILVGLYKLFVSMIRDALGSLYDSETIQGASANVINRLIGRPESRPDPREVKDPLGQELRELCSTTMVREAAALVLLLDVALGETAPTPSHGPWRIEQFEESIETIRQAVALGGPSTESVIQLIHPAKASPRVVRRLAMTMAGNLSIVADGGIPRV